MARDVTWPSQGHRLALARSWVNRCRGASVDDEHGVHSVDAALLHARAVKFNPDDLVEYVSHTATRGVFRVRFRDGTEAQVRAKTASEAKNHAAKTKSNRRLSPAAGGGLTQPKSDKPQ